MCFNGRRQSWNVISKLRKKASIPQQAGARRQGGGRGSLPPQQGVEEKAGRRRRERWEIKRESPARGAVEESVRGVMVF